MGLGWCIGGVNVLGPQSGVRAVCGDAGRCGHGCDRTRARSGVREGRSGDREGRAGEGACLGERGHEEVSPEPAFMIHTSHIKFVGCT